MRGSFTSFHPAVQGAYFACAVALCMFCLHPMVGVCALFGASAFLFFLKGARAACKAVLACALACALSGGVNLLVNSRGATVLFTLWQRPFTLEAFCFGVFAGLSFGAVISWFYCISLVFDTEKIMALFGSRFPSLALSFSLVLRFVPRFSKKASEAAAAQRGVGFPLSGNLRESCRAGAHLFSVLSAFALEGTVDTADSMAGRGFGLAGRTSYASRRFEKRDGAALLLLAGLFVPLLLFGGAFQVRAFPLLSLGRPGPALFGCLLLFFSAPAVLQWIMEVKWAFLRWKI